MIILLAVFGLIIGSFINALIWRLHQNTTSDKKLSVVSGRSMCPHCRHQLATRDLVPIISFVLLKGRCRYCHRRVAWQYPLIELLTAVVFVVCYLGWPVAISGQQTLLFSLWLVFVAGFMASAVYDLKWLLLPNKLIYPLLGLAVSQTLWLTMSNGSLQPLLFALQGALVGGGLFYLLFQLSGGKWIGGGDVKLGALAGILIGGPLNSFLMIFIASLLGTVISLPMLIGERAKLKMRIPFGPFLIVATIIVRLFGASLVTWYKQRFLGF